MDANIPVVMNTKQELPVPTAWRDVLSLIVERIISKDFEFSKACPAVSDILDEDKSRFIWNIEEYGGALVKPTEQSWGVSFYMYMQIYWIVWVYLPTTEENPSDLVMFVRVYEDGGSYRFDVASVHVP
ncbi:hypothetical protein [Niveispirillum sp.]|uniref:DUF7668 domain-containing protein n=1 Tax=Niveispirillum sp. TaxID=1917217 RepID=UPI001B769441|nr:hypothetical protein [Niveispirillum sp.]MBP7336676.1 hypothetical protein [Niveispirillum sp.]